MAVFLEKLPSPRALVCWKPECLRRVWLRGVNGIEAWRERYEAEQEAQR